MPSQPEFANPRPTLIMALSATGLLCCTLAFGAAEIVTDTRPPAPRVEHPPPPRDGYVWGAGHWEWNGRSYVWVSGIWIQERRAAHWVADHWDEVGARWHFVPGHWER
jgi:hypothetical protein